MTGASTNPKKLTWLCEIENWNWKLKIENWRLKLPEIKNCLGAKRPDPKSHLNWNEHNWGLFSFIVPSGRQKNMAK